jgi:hypothetical protein
MGTFGSGVFGGGGAGLGSQSAGVLLSSLLQPMLRIAGITVLAGTTPSPDQYGELVPMVNRFLGMWNLNGHMVYKTSISDPLPLVDGQKEYTIGTGGELDVPRPVFLKGADILFPGTPVLRRGLRILDDAEWRAIAIQDVDGAPPYEVYYDRGFDGNGLGKIYLRFQPPAGYSLELYTWQSLQTDFTSPDDIAIFPDGYAEAIVQNGALRVVSLNPLESKLDGAQRQELRRMAGESLMAVTALNMKCPRIGTESGLDRDDCEDDPQPWLSGGFR